MQFAIKNKITQNPLNYPYEERTFDIPKKSGGRNCTKTCNVLINCNLVRTLAIN